MSLATFVPGQKGGSFQVKGRWWVVNRAQGNETAALTCPDCGWRAIIEEHRIAPDGSVTPSVVCPNPECGFHENVRLSHWVDR